MLNGEKKGLSNQEIMKFMILVSQMETINIKVIGEDEMESVRVLMTHFKHVSRIWHQPF